MARCVKTMTGSIGISNMFRRVCVPRDAGRWSLCWKQHRWPLFVLIKRINFEKVTCQTTEQFSTSPWRAPAFLHRVSAGPIELSFRFRCRMISHQRSDDLFSPLAIDSFSLLLHVLWGNVISNLRKMSSALLPHQHSSTAWCPAPTLNNWWDLLLLYASSATMLPVGSHCGCSGRSTDATWAGMWRRSAMSTAYWQKPSQNP